MKRSEMILLLEKTILDAFFDTSIDIEPMTEIVLRTIEEAGMLPPFGSRMEQQDIVDRWGVNTGRSEIVRVIKPLWEPEDETQ